MLPIDGGRARITTFVLAVDDFAIGQPIIEGIGNALSAGRHQLLGAVSAHAAAVLNYLHGIIAHVSTDAGNFCLSQDGYVGFSGNLLHQAFHYSTGRILIREGLF